MPDETSLKQRPAEETLAPASTGIPVTTATMMRSTAPTITQPTSSLRLPLRTMRETHEITGTASQGRLSTLSSMVRPMPTTATRTMAITREDSRLDVLVTV